MNNEKIKKLLSTRMTITDIAKECGMTRSGFYKYCKRNGIDYSNREWFTVEEIQNLLGNYTVKEIAELKECSLQTIYRFCDKHSIDCRIKKPNITGKEISELVESGVLIKDIAKDLGVTTTQLYTIYSKEGYDFGNHEHQRRLQSEFMKNNNPVSGSRPQYILDAMMEGYVLSKQMEREYKLKHGITLKQYSRYARYDAYVKLKGLYDSETHSIDHIFSIKDCWDNHIPLELVSHDNNLQILPIKDNLSKADNSHISLEAFLKLVGVQRLSKSQCNWKKVE